MNSNAIVRITSPHCLFVLPKSHPKSPLCLRRHPSFSFFSFFPSVLLTSSFPFFLSFYSPPFFLFSFFLSFLLSTFFPFFLFRFTLLHYDQCLCVCVRTWAGPSDSYNTCYAIIYKSILNAYIDACICAIF